MGRVACTGTAAGVSMRGASSQLPRTPRVLGGRAARCRLARTAATCVLLVAAVAAAALPAGSLATPDAGDAHGARGAVRGAAGGAQPPNGTYDCRDGGCGARGVCTQRGTCICDFWHFGRSCGESFAAAYPAQYWAWFAWVGAAHLALALVVGSNLLLRRCTPLTAEHTHVRDAASAVVFLASVVRLVWLADPFRFDAVAGYSVVGSILMRVPQVLYVAGFFFVVLLWDGVRSAVAPDARRTRLLRIASVLVQLFVAGVSVSGSVLYGLNVTSQSADDRTLAKVAAAVANLVFAAISIVLFPVAMHYARNVYALLKRVEYMTSLTQQATFKAAMRGTLITLIWLTVNDVVLVTAVTLQAVFNWNLHSNFDACELAQRPRRTCNAHG